MRRRSKRYYSTKHGWTDVEMIEDFELGCRVNDAMFRKRLSMKTLASEIDVQQAQIQRLRYGDAVRLDAARKICRAVGLPI